jgi:GntR family transcriptional regulator
MFFHIDPTNGLAIYEQVARQVVFAVAGGALAPGEIVPSVREVAREIAVNPNTVARAYRELQARGVLEPVRGTGLAVTQGAVAKCREDRLRMIRARLQQVLVEAKQSRLDHQQLQALVQAEMAAINSEEGRVGQAQRSPTSGD